MATTTTIAIPDDTTIGDMHAAAGAVLDASASFVDWEQLAETGSGATSPPGLLLLSLAGQLARTNEPRIERQEATTS